jgi:hypothetical protein
MGKGNMAKTIYTGRMVNEAALTPTEHLEAILEAADSLNETARQGCGLQYIAKHC